MIDLKGGEKIKKRKVLISLMLLLCIALSLNFAFAADEEMSLEASVQSLDNESLSQIEIDDAVCEDQDCQNISEISHKTIEIVQENYEDYFNPRTGEILDDAGIAKGDILKIGNISGRAFVIDRPLTLMPITPNDEISNGFIHLVKGSDGSTITNLTINNTKGTLTIMGVTVGQLHGIWLSNSNNNLIAYNTIRIANAGGVYAMPMGWSSNNRIIYNDMKTYVTSNIIMGDCHYNLISHNMIEVLSYSDVSVTNLIYFNPFGHADYYGSPLCKGNIISYNYLKGFCTMPMSIILQMEYANHDGTVVANNTIFKGSFGVNLQGNNVSVYGNTIDGSGTGISVSGDDFTVNDNDVSGISQGKAISATAESRGSVFNNNVNFTDLSYAIAVFDNVDVYKNTVYIRNYGVGLALLGNNSRAYSNNIKNNHDSGVTVLGSYNLVDGNIIKTNNIGIEIPADTTKLRYYNNTISNNRITSERYGISIVGLVYNTVIVDNVIETNSSGINLEITDKKSNTELDNVVNGVILNSTAIVVDDSNFYQYFDEYGHLTYEFPEGKSKIIILTFLTNKNMFFDDKINVISNKQNNLLFNVTVTFECDSEGSLISDFNFVNYDKESIVLNGASDIAINRNNITSVMRKGSLSNSAILLKDVCNDVVISFNNIYVNSRVKYAYAIDVSSVNPSTRMMNKRLANGLSVMDNTIIMISTDMAEAVYNDAAQESEFSGNKINIISDGYGYGISIADVISRISNISVTDNEIVIHSKQMAYLIELFDVDNSIIANNTLYSDCNGSYAVGAYHSSNVSIEDNEITLFAGDLENIKYISDALGKGNSPIAILKSTDNVSVERNLIYTNATDPILINNGVDGNMSFSSNSFVVDGGNFNVYFNEGVLNSEIIAPQSILLLNNISDGRFMQINVALNISSYDLDVPSVVSLVLNGNASNSTLCNLHLVNSTVKLDNTSNVEICSSKLVSNNPNLLCVSGGFNNTIRGNCIFMDCDESNAIVLNGTILNTIKDNVFEINASNANIIIDFASCDSLIDNNTFDALCDNLTFISSINSAFENVTNNKLSGNASYACAYLASNVSHSFLGFNDIMINAFASNVSQSAVCYADSSTNNTVSDNSIIFSSAGSEDYAVKVVSDRNLLNSIVKNYLVSSNGLKRADFAVSAPYDYVAKNTPMDIYVSVDGDDDAGDGSMMNPYATIANAVKKAFNHAIIYVGDGYYNESNIKIIKDLSIVAINPGNVVIDANKSQLFNVTKKGTLLVDSLIIQNAYDEIGGSVFINDGDLRICNSVICNSSSYHDNTNPVFDRDVVYTSDGDLESGHTQDYINTGLGGAVLNYGTLMINSSMFCDNLGHWGGAIANYGKLSINSSQFSGNRGIHAGVIYSNFRGELSIENSLFTDNVALTSVDYCSLRIVTTSWSIDEGNRHAIRSDCGILPGIGGVIYTVDTSVSLLNSTFIGNFARTGGVIATSADSFNTVATTEPKVNLIIEDCYFANNKANDTRYTSGSMDLDNFNYNSDHDGGVVYGTFNKLHVLDSEFYLNQADHDGGVMHAKASDGKILDSIFMENTAGISGGALDISSNFLIMRTIISNNSARYGGAIEYTTPVYYGHIQDNFNIYNSTIAHNRALNLGGAFDIGAGNVTIRDSNIVDNLAPAYETIYTSGSSYVMDMRYNYWGTSKNGYSGPDDSVWRVNNNLFKPWYKEWVRWQPQTIEIDPVEPAEVEPDNPSPHVNPGSDDNQNPAVNPTSTGSSTSTSSSIGGNGNSEGNGKSSGNGIYSGNGDGNNLGPGDGTGSGASHTLLPGQKEYGGQAVTGIYVPQSYSDSSENESSNSNSEVSGTVDSNSLSKSNSSTYNEKLESVGMTANAAARSSGSSGSPGESGGSSSASSKAYEVTKSIDTKSIEDNYMIDLIVVGIVFVLLLIGYKRKRDENDKEY